jgi:Holliday junction resolvasome RuvABC endonuclease subunit
VTAYRVIGIDPALANVGLAVVESAKPGNYRVHHASTISTAPKQSLQERLTAIHGLLGDFIYRFCTTVASVDAIAVENATSRAGRMRGGENNPLTGSAMSVAVGVCFSVALEHHTVVAFIDVDEWMARLPMKRGSLTYTMPKPMLIRHLQTQIRFEVKPNEHVTMAAGVARYWIEQRRRKARLSA